MREALNVGLADKCDVNQIIQEYLVREEKQDPIHVLWKDMNDEGIEKACGLDAVEVFRQLVDQKREELCEIHEKRSLWQILSDDEGTAQQ